MQGQSRFAQRCEFEIKTNNGKIDNSTCYARMKRITECNEWIKEIVHDKDNISHTLENFSYYYYLVNRV